MGFRLSVAKNYVIEYGDTQAFNWKVTELHYLLDSLGVYYTGEEYDNNFEVSKADMRNAIHKLKNLDTQPEGDFEEIAYCLSQLEYTADEVVKVFERYLKEADPKHDYLYFSFH